MSGLIILSGGVEEVGVALKEAAVPLGMVSVVVTVVPWPSET